MKIEDLRKFDDIHTHLKAGPHAVCSLPPREAIALSHTDENQPFSIELHPWQASEELLQEFLEACEICKDDPRFVAVGEIGLDTNCATEFELQKKCFRAAAIKAKELDKPVIIHVVKAWDEMLRIVKEIHPKPLSSQPFEPPLIIHGFRKNAIFARQLIDNGFYLSLGSHYCPELLSLIPSSHLFRETDALRDI